MAFALASPGGVFSDEDECGAVFESTAADLCCAARSRRSAAPTPEVSIIPAADITQGECKAPRDRMGSGDERPEKMKVFLRIRPLTAAERERGEEQGCVGVTSEDTLLLRASKDSQAMRNAERGVAQSAHKFNFTQIFSPTTTQQEFYDHTMKEVVHNVLQGENHLLYTYGITNSGKTYTVQGVGKEPGLLPRALVSVFLKLSGRLYSGMDLKPVLCQDVRRLDASEVHAETIIRDALLKEDECASLDSGIGGLSTTSHIATQLEDVDAVSLEAARLGLSGREQLDEGVRFSVWVSFYEIYNEFLYDLLAAPPSLQLKKRATLRLSNDKHGNPYVKDLTWIQVHSADEAWKVLKAGQRNQSFASTHLNHNSSRSHSIFTVRILHVLPDADPRQGTKSCELLVCDLAGSERCKNQQNGERMKEANNINTSLHTLGRCITALRHNQNNRSRPPQVVPFRDSKLTRVLQNYFCGHGHSCMVVNINPCASTYDETLQALKFSAIATQLVHGPSSKNRVAYILSLLQEQQVRATVLEEEECSDEEDGDISMFDSEALLQAIDVLKREVLRQRQEKVELEASVREEVCAEMMEVISRMQNDFSETLETERALIEERYESKISNLETSLKKYYSQEIKEQNEQIQELTTALEKVEGSVMAPPPLFPPISEDLGPRRSQRLASAHYPEVAHLSAELEQCRAELDLCRTELQLRTLELKQFQGKQAQAENSATLTSSADRKLEEGQRNLRQFRQALQKLGAELQSGERACCRSTDGERLRQTLSAADDIIGRQDQMLVELHNSLQLVKADLRRKADTLAQLQSPASLPPPSVPGSCKRRGCGVTAPAGGLAENQPPEKRPFFRTLFSARTPTATPTRNKAEQMEATPYARVLRSRQPTPPPSPSVVRRGMKPTMF
ncbi:kinesin-like protein KIF20A [Denticeps clupeoides]|uniref:kinesin-like protein KIF20A n=1 Tax=Denticeps clupeoides TaxID=299321 RepID=UPI0010A489B3|nr:kinesin-like protein KIF20A [Denticeps clupeoides]